VFSSITRGEAGVLFGRRKQERGKIVAKSFCKRKKRKETPITFNDEEISLRGKRTEKKKEKQQLVLERGSGLKRGGKDSGRKQKEVIVPFPRRKEGRKNENRKIFKGSFGTFWPKKDGILRSGRGGGKTTGTVRKGRSLRKGGGESPDHLVPRDDFALRRE